MAEWENSAEAEARDSSGAGVRTHLEGTEDLGRRRGLVAESEDKDAGLDLFGREQAEAARLLPELHLCGSRRSDRDVGQSVAKRGVARLVERCKPVVEEATRRRVGDEAHLVAEPRQANEDGRVNGADVVAPSSGYRSVRGITEHDGVDLIWIVFVVVSRCSGCDIGGTGNAGVIGDEM